MSNEQGKEHSEDENHSEEVSRVESIPDDDLVVQILARLDGESYNQALYQDARVSLSVLFAIPCGIVPDSFHNTTHVSFSPPDPPSKVNQQQFPRPTSLSLEFKDEAPPQVTQINAPRHRQSGCYYMPRRTARWRLPRPIRLWEIRERTIEGELL